MRIESTNTEYNSGGPGRSAGAANRPRSSIFTYEMPGYTTYASMTGTFSDKSVVPRDFCTQNGVSVMYLSNGIQVLGTRCTRFGKCQPEWIDLQKYFVQAANEMGLTLVYGDVERTVAQSNAGRAKKVIVLQKVGNPRITMV